MPLSPDTIAGGRLRLALCIVPPGIETRGDTPLTLAPLTSETPNCCRIGTCRTSPRGKGDPGSRPPLPGKCGGFLTSFFAPLTGVRGPSRTLRADFPGGG